MSKRLGVYVHIPFCSGKCYYCDFVSGVGSDEEKAAYFAALRREIAAFDFSEYKVRTVYFGGGTPSSVPARHVTDTIALIRERAAVSDDAEITVECNPESLDEDKAKAYADAGVNRISMGLQTASDDLLKAIGRRHTVRDFIVAADVAQKYFSNVSADMMLGLPGQDTADVSRTVKLIAGRDLRHVSAYALKVEEGTPLAARGYVPDDDLTADLYDAACDLLSGFGYRRYEVSNFAFPGYECRHNLGYWKRCEYAGFGVAAHSFFHDTRIAHTSSVSDYINDVGDETKEYIPPHGEEAAEETLMLALRTANGLDLDEYARSFGNDLRETRADVLRELEGYAEIVKGRLRLTDKGMYVMNDIIVRLL